MYTYVCTRTHVGTDETGALKHAIKTIGKDVTAADIDINMYIFTYVHVCMHTHTRRYG